MTALDVGVYVPQVGFTFTDMLFRHPAVLAKMATTLDQISGGRLELGVGSRSIEDEHLRTGLPGAASGSPPSG